MMTFLGIAIYLVIDNTVFPNRTDKTVHRSVIHSVEETAQLMTHVFNAFRRIHSASYAYKTVHVSGGGSVTNSPSGLRNRKNSSASAANSPGRQIDKPRDNQIDKKTEKRPDKPPPLPQVDQQTAVNQQTSKSKKSVSIKESEELPSTRERRGSSVSSVSVILETSDNLLHSQQTTDVEKSLSAENEELITLEENRLEYDEDINDPNSPAPGNTNSGASEQLFPASGSSASLDSATGEIADKQVATNREARSATLVAASSELNELADVIRKTEIAAAEVCIQQLGTLLKNQRERLGLGLFEPEILQRYVFSFSCSHLVNESICVCVRDQGISPQRIHFFVRNLFICAQKLSGRAERHDHVVRTVVRCGLEGT
jgi:hypothetical protein